MKRTLQDKREKKIRRLHEEYMSLGVYGSVRGAGFFGGPMQEKVRDARIVSRAESPEEKRNVQVARELLDKGIGQGNSRDSPFFYATETEYSKNVTIHPYYRSRYDRPLDMEDAEKVEGYVLKEKYRDGWEYQSAEYQSYFDPEEQSRRKEIEKEVERLSGKNYWDAIHDVYEDGNTRQDRFGKDRRKLEERDLDRDLEKEVFRACALQLYERRGNRSYLEMPMGGIPGNSLMTKEDYKKRKEELKRLPQKKAQKARPEYDRGSSIRVSEMIDTDTYLELSSSASLPVP